MNIISSDINVLEYAVVFDLSGINPVINITNMSTGPNLAGVTYWVVALSPSQTPIHEGSFANPDEVGVWSTLTLADPWPRPFSQIEFSGAPYSVTLYAQDSSGNVFQLTKTAGICRPAGNTADSKNYYGVASTNVKVLCDQARVFFEDQTSTIYKGIAGTRLAAGLKMVYPLDATFTQPPAFQISDFSTAAVPISYSSDNYQFMASSTYSYDFGNYVAVVIKYQEIRTFSVLCNIDLMPLICEYQKLIDSIENGTCSDVQAANRKLTLINPKFSLVVIGIMQPLTGVDVPALIDEIKEIGGFECECCTAATGIIPNTSSVIDGYAFSVVSTCGDISGEVVQTGNNIQIKLADKTYIFTTGVVTGTTAFSVTPATTGCVKTYSLNVDATQLAQDILTIISTNAGLVNLFNSIVTNSGINLLVDGKCIFNSSIAFNYVFTLAGIPVNTTFALITGIQQGLVTRSLNFSLNLTNLPAFQTYLNTLGIGTFVVTNPSGQTVTITSTSNANQLSNLTYSIGASNFVASMSSSSTGYTPLSANQVVQGIIDYLCGITEDEITTSQDYTIYYIDEDGIQSQLILAGSTLSTFIQALLTAQQTTLANTGGNSNITCDKLKDIFPANNETITANDYIYGTKNGTCAQVKFNDAFAYMLSNMTPATKATFCQQVVSCGAGLACAPYNFLSVQVTNFDTACSPISGIEYVLS